MPTQKANLALAADSAKKGKKDMKKKVFSLALVVCCLSVFIASSTLAYFTKEDTATNVITTGTIDIALVETAKDASGEEVVFVDVSGVVPGQAVSKIVRVENVEFAREAWVRLKVDKKITLAEGNSGEIDLSIVEIDFKEDWTAREEDGETWYYYNKMLDVGRKTTALFEEVKFSTLAGNMYQDAEVTITVTAQAVQANNNGATALEAQGWPAIVGET